LNGDKKSFKYHSRYYVHPLKWREFSREYIINQWKHNKSHISMSDLQQGHPSCPSYYYDDVTNRNNITKYTIHFTHHCCSKTGPPHNRTAYKIGKWDHVLHYTMSNISSSFYSKNSNILQQKRGAGFWLWKPWILLHALIHKAKPCDAVCYCDTGAWWNNSAAPLWYWTTRSKYGIMVFNHITTWKNGIELTERLWTKRDAYILLGVDIPEMYDTIMRKATFSCYQKNPDSIHFLNELLFYSQDDRIITDRPNALFMDNIPNFHENRHDQSVLSLLSKKYGIPAFQDCSQYTATDVNQYGKIVKHWDVPWIIKHTRGKE